VVLRIDCPAWLDLAAYFNSGANTLMGVVHFPLGTPWAFGPTAPGNGAVSIPPYAIIEVTGIEKVPIY
jgi:hypothetical protein